MNSKVASIVTNKIIAKIEAGTLPWRKPWSASWQASYSTKRPYTGINQIILQLEAQDKGYNSNLWLTFRQAVKLGDIKGQQSTPIVFWGEAESEDKTDKDGEPLKYHFMRYYRVFNASQVEGLKLPEAGKIETQPKPEHIAENYLTRENIELKHGGNRAFYTPTHDFIQLPPRDKFESAGGYYSTLFHEMTHSTGHNSRLDRFDKSEDQNFGSISYSKEELVAELAASMLCHLSGVKVELDNSASYIKGWLKALNDDRGMIISASSRADKAVKFITN